MQVNSQAAATHLRNSAAWPGGVSHAAIRGFGSDQARALSADHPRTCQCMEEAGAALCNQDEHHGTVGDQSPFTEAEERAERDQAAAGQDGERTDQHREAANDDENARPGRACVHDRVFGGARQLIIGVLQLKETERAAD